MARFLVNYTFQGRASETVEAASKEEAEAAIEAKVNRADFELDPDDIDDVDFDVRELHPVTRGGKEIWTTYVSASDMRGHQSALATAPLFSGAA